MILLSAHQDIVQNNHGLSFKDGVLSGLLDNLLGIMIVYQAIQHPAMKWITPSVYHNSLEEYGRLDEFCPKLTPNDLVLVVDVCSGEQYNGYDFTIENVFNYDQEKLNKIVSNLEWEGFKVKVINYPPEEQEDYWDEAVAFGKLGIPTFSFIIPVQGESWHRETNISLKEMQRAVLGLQRLICYLS